MKTIYDNTTERRSEEYNYELGEIFHFGRVNHIFRFYETKNGF